MKVAKKTVPKNEWKQTPVILKATAGLRLLPEEKAKALLDEVKHGSPCCYSIFPVWFAEKKTNKTNDRL